MTCSKSNASRVQMKGEIEINKEAKENEINKKAREMERSAQNGINKESASSNTYCFNA